MKNNIMQVMTLIIPVLFLTVLISGCNQKTSGDDKKTMDTATSNQAAELEERSAYQQELEKIAYSYQEIYQQARSKEKLKTIETVEKIMNWISTIFSIYFTRKL